MNITVEQQELLLLGDILQKRLAAKVTDIRDFQVKCAIKNDLLMILTEHTSDVTVNTQQVFEVLAQTLQSQFNYKTQHIQFFLRVFGDKLPYAKYFLDSPMPTAEKELSLTEPIPDSFVSSPKASFLNPLDSILQNLSEDEDKSQEINQGSDPFVHIPDQPEKRYLLRSFPPASIIGTTVFIVFLYLSGTFVLHRGCVILECKELQTAKKFKGEYQQQIKSTKTDLELLAIQQKLDEVVADLQKIPQWSPRYRESQELVANLSQKSLKINQVLLALRTAISVEKRNLDPAKSSDELRNRQNLLRQAITRLNTVKHESEFRQLVQGNLSRHENSLNTITQQLIKEETWLKKIASAKTLGEAAIKGQATAKSVTDWQQVKFNLQTAINTLKTIPEDSFSFQDAGKLLAAYQSKIILADDNAKKEKLSTMSSQQVLAVMNQVKNDLNKTCTSNIKICTYAIEKDKIDIRLTVEYQSLLQANNPTMLLHFQSLQNALKVISQKYQLPVSIDNSQVQEQ
jgi:CRISPR/Cas system-associated endonuclease Cas3-HD